MALENAQDWKAYRVVLVQSVPCLSRDRKCQQEGSLDSPGEVHLEVLLQNTEEVEVRLGLWA